MLALDYHQSRSAIALRFSTGAVAADGALTVSGMELEKAVALIALGWLIGALFLMGRSIRRGRELAKTLAKRHPEIYETLGRPQPGYLHSVRRDRFAQFVGRREYEKLADRDLSARFEEYRKFEARLVLSVLVSLAVVAILVFAVQHGA